MKKLILLAMSSLLFAACSTVNTYEPFETNAVPNIIKDKRIITDSSCVKVVSLNLLNEKGGIKVQARLFNSSSSNKQINYKFTWFDKNGMELPSVSAAWKTVILEGKEVSFISAVSDNSEAVDFTLKFLEDVREY